MLMMYGNQESISVPDIENTIHAKHELLLYYAAEQRNHRRETLEQRASQ